MRVNGPRLMKHPQRSAQEGSHMKHVVRCMILLVGIGLAAVPAFAAELRVTGFIDNVFPRWDKNFSSVDQDPTRAGDEIFLGRTRNRTFFNFIASDDLRGVF